MAEAQLQQFLAKVAQLNAFVALSEADPALRRALRDCGSHHEVVAMAAGLGFDIGRRWGDPPATAASGGPGPGPGPGSAVAGAGQRNLLEGAPPAPGQERVELLLQTPQLRLERIHSNAAASPEGFWYEQRESEWVLLLRGSARLQFEDEPTPRDLCVGDGLLIRAGRRHRVVATDPDPGTLWLALLWSASA